MLDKPLFENYQNQRWIFSDFNQEDVSKVSSFFKITDVMSKVLIHNTGCKDVTDISNVLYPDESYLTDYSQLTDPKELKKAVDRLKQAQVKQEVVMVNGDPDADGISGTAILVAGLRQFGIKTDYDFPIRPLEGHGLQVRIIDKAKEIGATVVMTADCGTKDVAAVEYANQCGIDVIITDHHILGHTLPNALALINPCMITEKNDFHHLAGSTVSFKFIQALYGEHNIDFPEFLLEFGLMVSALGSLSDRVSLLSPMNRIIVKQGVEYFKMSEREGIKALREISIGKHLVIKPRHLSRTVIPRLNAPGRIGNPEENIPDSNIVVDLLLLGKGKKNAQKAAKVSRIFKSLLQADLIFKEQPQISGKEAMKAASDVDHVNERRKFITAKIEDEMDRMIEDQINVDSDKIIIVEGKCWNCGVIGIDTDRLKERFLRPAVIMTTQPGSDYIRGSSRSIPRINVYSLIDQVEQDFIKEYDRPLFCSVVESGGKKRKISSFGGHSQACGFSLHKDDVAYFKRQLTAKMDTLSHDSFEYHYDIIDRVTLDDITLTFMNQLDDFLPYGQRFEFPLFYAEKCFISGGSVFGNRYQQSVKNHVRFSALDKQLKSKNRKIEAVGFGLWEKYCYIKENVHSDASVDLVFSPEIDARSKSKRGKGTDIRLNVVDIRINTSE